VWVRIREGAGGKPAAPPRVRGGAHPSTEDLSPYREPSTEDLSPYREPSTEDLSPYREPSTEDLSPYRESLSVRIVPEGMRIAFLQGLSTLAG